MRALVQLVTRHSMPINCIEWPELRALFITLNPMALSVLPRSHNTFNRRITSSFERQKQAVKQHLHAAKSLIHFTTDTWRSGNRLELQAITARFVTPDGRLQKALLALKEMPEGHAGVYVAREIFNCLLDYEITHKIGWITSDNATANDTMSDHLCVLLSEELDPPVHWDPIKRRTRCLGHILNLTAQAFMTAQSTEAIDYAVSQSQPPPSPDFSHAEDAVKDASHTPWLYEKDPEEILGSDVGGWQQRPAI